MGLVKPSYSLSWPGQIRIHRLDPQDPEGKSIPRIRNHQSELSLRSWIQQKTTGWRFLGKNVKMGCPNFLYLFSARFLSFPGTWRSLRACRRPRKNGTATTLEPSSSRVGRGLGVPKRRVQQIFRMMMVVAYSCYLMVIWWLSMIINGVINGVINGSWWWWWWWG